jgi:hypothetical protein
MPTAQPAPLALKTVVYAAPALGEAASAPPIGGMRA